MHPVSKILARFALAILLVFPFAARADLVETVDGSKLVGKILKIGDGVVEIDTAFAGVVKVKQSSVAAFTTDAPVYLRSKSGDTIHGVVSTVGGEVHVGGTESAGALPVANVKAAWRKEGESPEALAAAAARRVWTFEAAVDILGKSGNSSSLASSLGFSATRTGPHDKLTFYTNYARAKQDSTTSVNQAKGGIDYSADFTPSCTWYVREETGRDRIQDLNFYSTTAAGLGFKTINTKAQQLTLRAGLAYRYESFRTGDSLNAPAADLELLHAYSGSTWRIGNSLTFMPSIEEFSNFRVLHDSFYERPLAASLWKIRVGVGNDYNNEPQPGKKKLDTTYYTKFLLSWK